MITLSTTVSTLDHTKLRSSDFVDLSGHNQVFVNTEGGRFETAYARPPKTDPLPFPPHTRGYFYYHSPPTAPIAGALRFRCLPDKYIHFSEGTDLMDPHGAPWQLSLLWAIRGPVPGFVDALMLESAGCVDRAFIERAQAVVQKTSKDTITERISVVYDFGQQFKVKLRNDKKEVLIAHGEQIGVVWLNELFMRVAYDNKVVPQSQHRKNRIVPFEGSSSFFFLFLRRV